MQYYRQNTIFKKFQLKALLPVESEIIYAILAFTGDHEKLFHQARLFRRYFMDFRQLLI